MLNKVILIGRITKDPELKSTPNGVSVLSFPVACQRNFKQDGEYKSDFINCVAFKNTAEFIDNYFSKGEPIAIVGRLQSRTWEDNDGKKRYTMEVIIDSASFVSSKEKREEIADLTPSDAEDGAKLEGIDTGDFEPVSDDDLPF